MHVSKVHHVTTIARVAEKLGKDEDWLRDVANEMEIEDGVIWVCCRRRTRRVAPARWAGASRA